MARLTRFAAFRSGKNSFTASAIIAALAIAAALFAPSVARATIITDSMSFADPLLTGSYAYDTTAAAFTAFSITWNNPPFVPHGSDFGYVNPITFNFFNGAGSPNAPIGTITGSPAFLSWLTNGAEVFALFTGVGSGVIGEDLYSTVTEMTGTGGHYNYEMNLFDQTNQGTIEISNNGAETRFLSVGDSAASFTMLTPAPAPEPSTFVLTGLGLLGMGIAALRKKYRRV